MGQKQSVDTAHVAFVEDEASACHSCANPCHDHEQVPSSLLASASEPMENSFGKPYGKHVVVCTASMQWAPKVLDVPHSLPHLIDHDLRKHDAHLPWRVMVTASDDKSLPVELKPGAVVDRTEDFFDVLVFPDMLRIRSVSESRVHAVVEVLRGDQPAELLVEKLEVEAYVAVCAHGARDKRCGVAGPMIIEEFHNELDKAGIRDRVQVSGSSHIGGHKFAGTCIVYPTGDWYGKLIPCDVQNIVEQCFIQKKVIRSKWRGRPPVVKNTL